MQNLLEERRKALQQENDEEYKILVLQMVKREEELYKDLFQEACDNLGEAMPVFVRAHRE